MNIGHGRIWRTLATGLLWIGVSESGHGEDVTRKPAADEASEVSPLEMRLRTDLAYLASDELAGRDTGSPGLELAAQYIAQSFTDAGLKTDLFDGQPFQTFEVSVGATVGDENRNRLAVMPRPANGGDDTAEPPKPSAGDGDGPQRTTVSGVLGKTFQSLAIGDSAKVQGPLVFAGYGITAPELSYDDYASIDAQGSIVVILRKEPQGPEADKVFDGDRNTRHAYFEAKIRNAADHGAIGVLLVNDPGSIEQTIRSIDRRIARETEAIAELKRQIEGIPPAAENIRRRQAAKLGEAASLVETLQNQRQEAAEGLMNPGDAGQKVVITGLPVASVAWSLASGLIESASGQTLDAVKRVIDTSVSPASIDLQVDGLLETSLSPSSVSTSNVLGVLAGRGNLADETVVVGAHYDHVGMGGPGSLAPGTIAVHNGADDNASGTTVLLSAVHQVSEALRDVDHHRRVLFIAFTGEERGLLGSEHYVTHPRFPLEKTVAMVNLDMVGRLRNNDLTVYGVGTSSQFDALVDRANQQTGFQLFKVSSGYGPSDHQSFYTRKIPVLFFFTGLHSDYHRPSDKIDKINFNGMARITDITTAVVVDLAAAATRPDYATTDREVNIRQQRQVYLGVSLQEAFDRAEGVEAAESDQPAGAIVSAVAPGSPAEAAGLRVGDRLMKLNGVSIRSLSDVIEIVGEREENDRLEIELTRSGEAIQATATLKLRPGQ